MRQMTQVGDTLVVTDQSGAELFNGPVTQDIIDNDVEVSATTPADGEEVVGYRNTDRCSR